MLTYWIAQVLEQQPCLLLLDGLDEITDYQTRQQLIEDLESLIYKPAYAHIRCVLTTRPHGLLILFLQCLYVGKTLVALDI